MAPLSWRHHTLIQALLTRGPLAEKEFRSMLENITGKSSGSGKQHEQRLLNEYLGKINAELSYVQLELRACQNQYDGVVYYGVVNNVPDEQSKLGTKYTVPQIAFYRGIVETIVQDAEAGGFIYNTDALNVRLETQVLGATDSQSQTPPAFKAFSISQKEKALNQLVKDQWLCSTPEGMIGIGVRSFLDLRSWFRSNEVPACEVCNEAAIKAQLCQNEACNVRLHLYCLKKKFSGKKAGRVCPGCGTQWHVSTVKGEATEEMNNSNGPSQTSQRPKRSTKRSRRSYQEANSDAAGDDASPSFDDTNTKRSRRSYQEANSDAAGDDASPSFDDTNTKRSRRSYQEANSDAAEDDASPSFDDIPDTKRATRRSARLSAN